MGSARGMTAALVVPADRYAEQVVIGCAVSTVHGAALAVDRLAPTDFYWPAHGRLLAAAGAITTVVAEADRIAASAGRAGVPEAQVAALVASRCVMWDTSGSFARRVIEAARRRRLMCICEATYRRIAEGGTAEEALSVLREAS